MAKDAAEFLIASLADMADGAAKGFDVEVLGKRRDLFGVRRGDTVHVYINSCPHIGTPLNIQPDRFLTSDGKLINCSTHGALFHIESGLCIAGPCKGRHLRPVPARVRGGDVFIETGGFDF
jgi:nitrite reductase/ring-hydroxylating ferredoxin subunit